jgi:hypothetical protein
LEKPEVAEVELLEEEVEVEPFEEEVAVEGSGAGDGIPAKRNWWLNWHRTWPSRGIARRGRCPSSQMVRQR